MTTEENIIYVGKRPTMSYVLAVVTQFNQGTAELSIKARGKAISKAVDVAEIVKNKFFNEASVEDIRISTEEVTSADNVPLKVSAIEIQIRK